MKIGFQIAGIIAALCAGVVFLYSCNNPFSTREPDPRNPGSTGAAIKPPNSPENVIDNLKASFEGLSIQDYLDVFNEDFQFNPDSEDSLEYEQDFVYGWNYENEMEFAQNFLQRNNFKPDIEGSPVEIFASYSYKPGQDMYQYNYKIFINLSEKTETYEGYSWLFLREDTEGKWSVYRWVDFRLRKSSLSWGVLRAQHI